MCGGGVLNQVAAGVGLGLVLCKRLWFQILSLRSRPAFTAFTASVGSFEPGLASCGVSCTPPLRLAPHVKEMRLQLRTGHPRSAFAETGADSTD